MADARIFQLHGIHQVMQRDVRVAASQARQQRSHQSRERHNRVAAKCAEQKIEPHHVRLQSLESRQQAEHAGGVVERPAASHSKSLRLEMIMRELVRQYREIQKRISLQFLRNVKSVLAQPSRARRKSRYQTNLHSSPVCLPRFDVLLQCAVAGGPVVEKLPGTSWRMDCEGLSCSKVSRYVATLAMKSWSLPAARNILPADSLSESFGCIPLFSRWAAAELL